MSVGTQGTWRVEAPGVHPVHLYIYFDGQTLFLQSPDVPDPPTVDGRPLPASWTPAAPQCTVSFGRATLVFEPVDDLGEVEDVDPTHAQPLGEDNQYENVPTKRGTLESARRDMPARPFKPGAFVAPADDEATRLQPLEEVRPGEIDGEATRIEPLEALSGLAPSAVAPVRPAAGIPWSRPAPVVPPPVSPAGSRPLPPTTAFPLVAPTPMPAVQRPPPPSGGFVPPGQLQFPQGPTSAGQAEFSGVPSGLLNVPPPSIRKPDAAETLGEKIKREWNAAPPLRRVLFAALPVGVGLAFWLIFTGDPPPPPRPAPSAPGASASSRQPPPTVTPPPVAQVPTAWPPIEPAPVVPRPPLPPPSATPGATVAAGDAAVANSDRRERQAADFVATHAYDQAIRIYDQLALERPQNPAFREAARILRTKLETGTP